MGFRVNVQIKTMEKTTAYAQIRYQIAQLEAKAKEMEQEVVEELKDTKADTTQYGKVQVIEFKTFTYSDDFLNKKLMVDTEIKNFTEGKKSELKELQSKEEEGQTPEIKKGLRFTANKDEA